MRDKGCDRAGFNAVNANSLVFTLNDVDPSRSTLTNTESGIISGAWVRGAQNVAYCNLDANGAVGEFARNFSPCPTGSWPRAFSLNTAGLTDGAHTLQVCSADYGQAVGLNGTGGWSCDQRAIHVDNTPPSAPGGLAIATPNPARYLDHFGARWTLPADAGSPITKVHYDIVNAAGAVVVPEKTIAATNPIKLDEIAASTTAGEYRLRVWLEDGVGLTGPVASVPIPRDTTPPAAPQDLSVTAPTTTRSEQGFDVRWRNIVDAGSAINAVHYQVLNGNGDIAVATKTIGADNPQAIGNLDTPRERGDYTLRLWLSDAEGNVGAPVAAPLSYDCVRSELGGGLTLTAGLGSEPDGEVVVNQNEGATLTGKLQGLGGQLANTPLCVFSRVITDSARDFLGVAMTGPDGGYRFAIGGGPSRDLAVVYRPNQRELTARATLRAQVRPTFKLKKKAVHNGGFAVFAGSIPGPHNEKVVVVLQVKSGKGWRVFRRYRTRDEGRFLMRCRFTRTKTPTTYIMRAQVRAQGGYPYEEGNSRTIPVRVEP